MLKSVGVKLVVTGLPKPVTRSYPTAAEYPFDPLVMSRKYEDGDPSAYKLLATVNSPRAWIAAQDGAPTLVPPTSSHPLIPSYGVES
jgi:hypothetical protein